MPKYSTSDEIYRQLVADSDESWLYGLVAFAVVEEQRIEWAIHHEKHNGRPPTTVEIAQWYESQPESVLLRAKGTAENALQAFTEEALETVVDAHRKEIEESIVVGEIRSLNKFLPQFGISLAASVTSAVVIASILIIFAFLVFNDISPVDIGKKISDDSEVIRDGKEQGTNE